MATSLKLIVAVLALLWVGVTAADAAATLYTPAQYRLGRYFDCNIINIGSRDVTVTIQIFDFNGNLDHELVDSVLSPGTGTGIDVNPGVGSPYLYCKFIVTKGSKSSVRASYCVEDAGNVCAGSGEAR